MSITSFPRQDVSEAEKNRNEKAWYKQAVDYAAGRYCGDHAARFAKIARMQNSYNGVVSGAEFAYLNSTYGKDNTVPYIDYRLCRAKIDLLVGEELAIPLNGTVYTTNPEAHVQRLEEIAVPVGMHAAADQIGKLRGIGVDVFSGMPVPEVPQGKTIFETLSKKSQNETIMQYISNRQIDNMKLKLRLNDNFLDATLNSECFGKVYINSDSEVQMRSIAIENALFDEGQLDPFLDNSPGLGERRIMFYHEILKEFNLTKAQADELWEMQTAHPDGQWSDINYPRIGGALAYSVYTYEWIGLQSERVKVYTDAKSGEEKTAFLSSEYYEANEGKLRKEEKKGKYKIITKYKYVLYEATRIGANMYPEQCMRMVENMPASISRPAWTMRRYVGMLFGTVGGVRISIKQMTEHIDKTYNLIMYQINRELHKAKGKVLVLDLAGTSKGETSKQRMYKITNDGVIEWNSAEEGNEGARNIEGAVGVSAIDLGISSSINTLIPLKVDLEQTADRITGILQNRMGNIAASATVSNTQQSVAASRTTTAGLFYFFAEYIERVMRLTLEFSKISYGVLRPDIGDMVLGVEKMQFLKMTPDFAFQDYGYKLGDIMKEMDVRNMLREWAPIVLNSQPEMVETFMEAAWTETTAEIQGKIRNAFKKINEAKQAEAQAQSEAAMAQKQVMVDGTNQVQQTKNEGDLAKVAAQGQVATSIEGQKGKNAAILQRNNAAMTPEKTARK